jgi:DnaJ-class molecular chaperone
MDRYPEQPVAGLLTGAVAMTKPIKKLSEKACPVCKGAGHIELVQPNRPIPKIYPAECQRCFGKGRIPLAEATDFANFTTLPV